MTIQRSQTSNPCKYHAKDNLKIERLIRDRQPGTLGLAFQARTARTITSVLSFKAPICHIWTTVKAKTRKRLLLRSSKSTRRQASKNFQFFPRKRSRLGTCFRAERRRKTIRQQRKAQRKSFLDPIKHFPNITEYSNETSQQQCPIVSRRS